MVSHLPSGAGRLTKPVNEETGCYVFGKRSSKEPESVGPYKVDKVAGRGSLEKLLNERHLEGYDLVTVLQNEAFGSNSSRDVVFRLRD